MSMSMNQERRQQRSSRPIEALGLLLQATVERFALETACLANEDGLLLAAAGDAQSWDTLAAFAPLLAASSEGSARVQIEEALHEHLGRPSTGVRVRPCRAPNQRLFIVTLARNASAAEEASVHGGDGTERILAAA